MGALLSILGTIMPAVSFEGLTVTQWATIASAIAAAEPEIKSTITALHPVFAAIASDLYSGKSTDEAASIARSNNIPGYGVDGSVEEISNK
jgi:hypothetical protein